MRVIVATVANLKVIYVAGPRIFLNRSNKLPESFIHSVWTEVELSCDKWLN